jgi:hypothetical protein
MVLRTLPRKYGGSTPGSFLLNGQKGRFNWFVFAAMLILWSVDDVGTAIGLQATEIVEQEEGGIASKLEGNPWLNAAMAYALDNNWVETETSFLRMWWLFHMVLFGTYQYMGWFGDWWLQFFLVVLSMFKAYAGYDWWSSQPNDFTVTDFLSFKNGDLRPERRLKAEGAGWFSRGTIRNVYLENFAAKYGSGPGLRRRLGSAKIHVYTPSAMWITSILPILSGLR